MIGWLRLMNWTHRKYTLKFWRTEHFVPLPLFAKSLCFSRSHLEGLENYTGHRSYPNPPTIMIFPLKTQYAQTSINQSNITLKHKNILPDGLFYVHIFGRLIFWMITTNTGSKVPLGSPAEPILIADVAFHGSIWQCSRCLEDSGEFLHHFIRPPAVCILT